MRIGIDIMGGDFAPASIIEGVLLAQKEQKDNTELVLFGDKKKNRKSSIYSQYRTT